MITLHPYQQDLKAGIYGDWQKGARNVLAVLPTGGGKSVVVSDITLDGQRTGLKQAIIAHRNELVSQMSHHIARQGIYHRIIANEQTVSQITRSHRSEFGRSYVNPSAPTNVVGVDTMMSRHEDLAPWAAQIDRWTIDEAHHVIRKNKWGRAVEMFCNASGLGVTATPQRADGLGLGKEYDGEFDSMVLGPSMRTLIKLGNLSDYEIVCPTSDLVMDEGDITGSGDFSPEKMREKAKKSHIVGDVVKAYCRYAWGKKAICFATDTDTAGKIAADFNKYGIRAAALSAKTQPAVREKFVNEFKAGTLWILVNVDLFDEGFDVPSCDCVIMARPTASLGKYLQMFGRALRVYGGKTHGLIIDHVSNVLRHKLPDMPRMWTLARREKRSKGIDPDDIPMTVCTGCARPYERFRVCCPWCGETPPLPQPRDRSISMVDGDLMLLDRAKLEQMRAATYLESPADIGQRVSGGAGGAIAGKAAVNRQIEKFGAQDRLIQSIAQWAAIQRDAGLQDREIDRKFYLLTGMDKLSALSGQRSRQEFDTMAEMIEGWYAR